MPKPKSKQFQPINMTARVSLVLEDLAEFKGNGGWARPMDVGGKNTSHHSHTLKALVDAGYAERKSRFPKGEATRGSFVYRVTKRGRDWLRRRKA